MATKFQGYSFKGGSDGAFPQASLIINEQGPLYGTTPNGGSSGSSFGTVFKLTPPAKGQTPWTEAVLYSFKGGSDGANPYATLIIDEQGALYGTTLSTTFPSGGGSNAYFGTVFKLTPPAKVILQNRSRFLTSFEAAIPGAGGFCICCMGFHVFAQGAAKGAFVR